MHRDPRQEEREIIGHNIELMLAFHDMDGNALAEKVGATPQQVSTWRRGRVRPGPKNLHEIAGVFKRTPGWFLDVHPEFEPAPPPSEEDAA
jgi:transcriptional regulator with XRE-family HTH domain